MDRLDENDHLRLQLLDALETLARERRERLVQDLTVKYCIGGGSVNVDTGIITRPAPEKPPESAG